MVLDCEVEDALVDDALAVLRTLHRRTVDLVGKDTAEGLLVLDDDALDLYTKSFAIKELQMIRIEGPIDHGDITAMLEAQPQVGRRWTLSYVVSLLWNIAERVRRFSRAARSTWLQPHLLRTLPVMSSRSYAFRTAAFPARPSRRSCGYSPRAGLSLVRPQDTELLGNSVDIGICTAKGDELARIDTSLVFCRPDGTWHAREAA